MNQNTSKEGLSTRMEDRPLFSLPSLFLVFLIAAPTDHVSGLSCSGEILWCRCRHPSQKRFLHWRPCFRLAPGTSPPPAASCSVPVQHTMARRLACGEGEKLSTQKQSHKQHVSEQKGATTRTRKRAAFEPHGGCCVAQRTLH